MSKEDDAYVDAVFPPVTSLKLRTGHGGVAPYQIEGRIAWSPIEHNNGYYIDLGAFHEILDDLSLKILVELKRSKPDKHETPVIGGIAGNGIAVVSKTETKEPKKVEKAKEGSLKQYTIFLDYDEALALARNNSDEKGKTVAHILDTKLKEAVIEILWQEYKATFSTEIKQSIASFSLGVVAILLTALATGSDLFNPTQADIDEYLLSFYTTYVVFQGLISGFISILGDDSNDTSRINRRDGYGGNHQGLIEASNDRNSNYSKLTEFDNDRFAKEAAMIYSFLCKLLLLKDKPFEERTEKRRDLALALSGIGATLRRALVGAIKNVPYIPIIQKTSVRAAQSLLLKLNSKRVIGYHPNS